MSRVYVSLPLTGPVARLGREVLRGAELALERAGDHAPQVVAVLDGYRKDGNHGATANAQRAAQDREAIAYLGDFYSTQVMESAPILSDAGVLQVAPVATFTDLRGDTLVRIMPNDEVGANAIATWLTDAGVRDLLVVHDHDEGYGIPVAGMCVTAARDTGIAVRSLPVWNEHEALADDIGDAQALLYVGVAGSGAATLWHELHAAKPEMWLLGSEGIAQPWLARELIPTAAERTRFFVAPIASWDVYGFEAMALILDAIAAGGNDRAAVVHAARSTTDRDSIIGRYSIDEQGHTTSTAYGRLAVLNGELVWDR